MSDNEHFLRWHTEATAILDWLEQLAGRARALGPPPPSSDTAAGIDAKIKLWKRCGFTPMAPGFPAPWESKASLLSDHLRRMPEDFLR
jgi:hypothetical protein